MCAIKTECVLKEEVPIAEVNNTNCEVDSSPLPSTIDGQSTDGTVHIINGRSVLRVVRAIGVVTLVRGCACAAQEHARSLCAAHAQSYLRIRSVCSDHAHSNRACAAHELRIRKSKVKLRMRSVCTANEQWESTVHSSP